MGYAGYTPAKLPPSKPSDLEAAVQAVKYVDSLEVLGKLVYNCAVQPKEEKFRRVKLSNTKIQQTIVAVPEALEVLRKLGWVNDEADADFLVVPPGLYFTMKEARVIEDAKERLRKLIRSASGSKLSAMAAA